MNTDTRVALLAETLSNRLTWFKAKAERVRLESPTRLHGHLRLFDLFDTYIDRLQANIKRDLEDPYADPEDLTGNLRILLTQHKAHHKAFDDLFSRDGRDIPQSFSYFVHDACQRWNLPSTDIILTVGPPGNFVTRSSPFWDAMLQDGNDHGDDRDILSIAVPEHEGTRTRWIPIILGHELAHHLIAKRPINGLDEIEASIRDSLAETRRKSSKDTQSVDIKDEWVTDEVIHSWVEELVCDAYAIHMFGPAGAAANLEFLSSLGDPTKPSRTHPPTSFRAESMKKWLEAQNSINEALPSDQLRFGLADEAPKEEYARQLCAAMRIAITPIMNAVSDWSVEQSYSELDRENNITSLTRQLENGIPGSINSDSSYDLVDVTNACWRASQKPSTFPIDRLAAKAIEDLYFVRSWQAAGGDIVATKQTGATTSQPGVLTTADFHNRINIDGDDQIAITPLLPGALGPASIDLRLGNRFIIFEQTANAAFDALQSGQDPRSMQSLVEKGWGKEFYLHPGQLVLAATLEYIVLPNDLCAQVVGSAARIGDI